ncbi:Flp1 family type IVb pilin [Mediterraneibacter agrestimuris]|uniref:Flp1 family type IVb pilin n=1 Tax=Mediterraneibacter agrestimuris TaxID=2941333 RepID=UPI00203F84A6|nr:Flp1 family type IVb pilin [Mediterraneibacter agrestimuris]
MIKLQIIGWRIRQKVRDGIQILKDDSGLSVIEMLLILVVIIALVLIFKTQLTNLVNTIFQKITSESSGI